MNREYLYLLKKAKILSDNPFDFNDNMEFRNALDIFNNKIWDLKFNKESSKSLQTFKEIIKKDIENKYKNLHFESEVIKNIDFNYEFFNVLYKIKYLQIDEIDFEIMYKLNYYAEGFSQLKFK